MAFEYETGGDLTDGGSEAFLKEPGTYHVMVMEVDDPPMKQGDHGPEPIANGAFKVHCQVLGGSKDGQKDKICDIMFFNPKPDPDEKKVDFNRKKIDKFFLAVSLVKKDDLLQKGKKVSVDLQNAIGRQFVGKWYLPEPEEGRKTYFGHSFSDIWHVDDSAVANVPKNEKALKLLPPDQRWIGNQSSGKSKEPANGAAAQPERKTTAADYSDL